MTDSVDGLIAYLRGARRWLTPNGWLMMLNRIERAWQREKESVTAQVPLKKYDRCNWRHGIDRGTGTFMGTDPASGMHLVTVGNLEHKPHQDDQHPMDARTWWLIVEYVEKEK